MHEDIRTAHADSHRHKTLTSSSCKQMCVNAVSSLKAAWLMFYEGGLEKKVYFNILNKSVVL